VPGVATSASYQYRRAACAGGRARRDDTIAGAATLRFRRLIACSIFYPVIKRVIRSTFGDVTTTQFQVIATLVSIPQQAERLIKDELPDRGDGCLSAGKHRPVAAGVGFTTERDVDAQYPCCERHRLAGGRRRCPSTSCAAVEQLLPQQHGKKAAEDMTADDGARTLFARRLVIRLDQVDDGSRRSGRRMPHGRNSATPLRQPVV
jgi:hypothetical protein